MKLGMYTLAIVIGVLTMAVGALAARLAFSALTSGEAAAVAVGLGVVAAWGSVSLSEHWLRNREHDQSR
jgi:hypothetical protein